MKNVLLVIVVWLGMLILASYALADDVMITGYLQGLYGGGLDEDNPTSSEWTASETRLQMRLESYSSSAEFFGRMDFVYDDFAEPAFEANLREGYVKFRLGSRFDLKAGRQIVTWGTGDLIFINDVFAKDYQSFFNGRDDQYLKAPHNALRVEFYSDVVNATVVYSPRFEPNRIPTGERFSYFNPMAGDIVGGEGYIFEPTTPAAEFENGEVAAKFSRYFGSADVALYAYHGFYKNPVGMDPMNGTAFYPELNVFGGSIRTPLLKGIAWLESGYYHSREDTDGDDPFIPNSSVQSLVGYERQIAANLTANVQYQNEMMLNHDKYISSLPPGSVEFDEIYHLLTTRITKLLKMETITLSAFAFYSPSEEDLYGRFSVSYKYTDALTLALGANIFHGEEKYTDFGAFQQNDNVYLKITYGY